MRILLFKQCFSSLLLWHQPQFQKFGLYFQLQPSLFLLPVLDHAFSIVKASRRGRLIRELPNETPEEQAELTLVQKDVAWLR